VDLVFKSFSIHTALAVMCIPDIKDNFNETLLMRHIRSVGVVLNDIVF